MNLVTLMGRLSSDPDIRKTDTTTIARYRLAVDRMKRDGEQTADFIGCVCFGKSAEFAEKYLSKGMKIAIEGRIQTGSYESDGRKIYTTDVVVNRQYFCEKKGTQANVEEPKADENGFMDVPIDEELPFI